MLPNAQYPLHYVTYAAYAATKFEDATSNDLGGDAFTRNMTDNNNYARTTDRLWYKITIAFFLKKKAGIMTENIIIWEFLHVTSKIYWFIPS